MSLQRLILIFILLVVMPLATTSLSYAEEESTDKAPDQAQAESNAIDETQTLSTDTVKTLSGISIIGNKDAPKSLYIVPWRGSELEMETDLSSSLLNEGFHAVDKDVFIRELSFYESTTESTSDK